MESRHRSPGAHLPLLLSWRFLSRLAGSAVRTGAWNRKRRGSAKRGLATAVAVALTAVLTPSPANADGTGYFDPVPTVNMVEGCSYAYFTVNASFTNNNGWSLEIRVLYPDLTLFHLDVSSGPPTDGLRGEIQMVFCHPKDPPGIYTIEGTLETVDLDASHHTVALAPITFQVVAPPPPPPAVVNTQPPNVTGAPIAPQVGYPLTATFGVWTPGGAVVTDQWLADGQPIPGATGTTYAPTLSDLGKAIAVTATASLSGYVSATATSLPTHPVSKLVQNSERPWLKGPAKVGERLRVKPGLWQPVDAVTFRYRWYADGRRIRGARDDRLRLTLALKGSKIYCLVSGSARGLDPVRVRTRASAKVER